MKWHDEMKWQRNDVKYNITISWKEEALCDVRLLLHEQYLIILETITIEVVRMTCVPDRTGQRGHMLSH